VKRSLVVVACFILACSGITASGTEYPPEPDYRASEVCMVDLTTGGLRPDAPRLIVHAIEPFGMVLPGASITVEHARQKVADALTDATGQAILEGLPVGKGRVRLGLEGFRSVDVPVRLRQGCVTAIIVPMEVGSMIESTQTSRP
jgi:hypothetical protein